ncbi:MAG: S41 family peptidase [Firmicutes bacterium]|nr:S41 family peptidase [Bacillota bacterium]
MEDDKMNNQNIKGEESKKIFTTSETILLVIFSLIIGISIGFLFNKGKIITQSTINKDEHLNEFVKNYNYILENYYKDIDQENLINSAIAGMMESLDDPYSMYFGEEETDNFSISLNGSYEGVGIQITKDVITGYMLITSVFKDSPAAEAGLIAGDMIISIDDNLAKELTASEFSSIIRNGTNESYKLKVLRDEEKLEIILSRKVVTLTSVTSEIYEQDDKKIGYIYIGIFANNTYSQFKKELEKLEKENIDYLILDVRGNTGGHLTAVDKMLDLFLGKKQILYQFEQNGQKTAIYGTGNENKPYEIILLGDSTSASASEVLIAGLKENLGCIFIGKQTYGKGTVQELITLSDGTQYKITVKKWLTPKGNWINDTKGITPDIEVELDDKYYETYLNEDDTQLQRAIQYIREK